MPYAHNGSIEIYYETFGDPQDAPLVLVNGLSSQCINFSEEWCERFVAQGFYTVRLDNRDVGLSSKFDGAQVDLGAAATAKAEGREADLPYRLPDMADDVLAVLDALGIPQAHVMGLSLGGMIVQTLAIEHPDRLLSVTSVMSTTGDPDVGQSTPEALGALLAPAATDRDSAIERHLAGIRIYGSPDYFDEDHHRALAGAAFDRCFYPAGVVRQAAVAVSAASRSEALRAVAVPALVIHGDRDPLIDISGGRRTAECIPGARFEVLEGMAHDYPRAFWDRWVALVADHAGVSPAPRVS
jgi:pimeloyl-ACP methyl ester carboxylesterase